MYGLLAAGAATFSTVLSAPAAHAGTGNYLQITNNAGILANTCYKWRDAEDKNYCHNVRPVGTTWKAYFPAGATGAKIDLSASVVTYATVDTAVVTDTNRNHCFEVTGLVDRPKLQETGC
ncbi:hypothetical protein [Streptomyces sp. GS7]|uniref:hypothetical protein n=1 Tax=Streptomyces sp. GS7 TaxID=2692234 RepID=UPI001319435B|nr:hypothetical protein [Streptomyces sp. GS7]QHC23394.1 hypothetical protein GR130_20365 [Streptomyces sp. GS7]